MNNNEIINKLSKYIGIPCVHGQNTMDGMSCLALTHNVLHEFGVTTTALQYLNLSSDWWKEYPHLIEDELYKMGYEIFGINELKQSDVVLFAMVDGCDIITHIGVMVDEVRFIHAVINTRSKISKINSPFWRNRLKKMIRMR